MASKSTREYRLSQILEAAGELVQLLAPGCQRIEVAGSIRRQCDTVRDIDLVAHARYTEIVTPSLFGEPQLLRSGPDLLVSAIRGLMVQLPIPPVDVRILRFAWQNLPVEIYLTEPDGSNWGALLQMRTGSAAFNQWLAKRCRANGWQYKAGHGIFAIDDPDVRIDDGTEEGIFAALGLHYTPPEKRDF